MNSISIKEEMGKFSVKEPNGKKWSDLPHSPPSLPEDFLKMPPNLSHRPGWIPAEDPQTVLT